MAYMHNLSLTEIVVSNKQFDDALDDAEKLVIYPDKDFNMCIRLMPSDQAEDFIKKARDDIANRNKELKNV